MSGCEATSNGQRDGGGAVNVLSIDEVVAMFDFREQGNVNLTTGNHVLTSTQGPTLVFNAFQQGSTFDIAAGIALRFRANATSTVFPPTPGSRTAAKLSFLWGDFYTAFGVDALRDYAVVAYCSLLSIPTAQSSPNGFQLGMVQPAGVPISGGADRLRALKRNNAAGAQALGSVSDVTAGGNYTSPAVTANTKVFGSVFTGDEICFYAGDWDTAGGESWEDVRLRRQVQSYSGAATGFVWKDQGVSPYFAFPTGQVSADMAVDVERLVVLAR